jgi:hypothetical protein
MDVSAMESRPGREVPEKPNLLPRGETSRTFRTYAGVPESKQPGHDSVYRSSGRMQKTNGRTIPTKTEESTERDYRPPHRQTTRLAPLVQRSRATLRRLVISAHRYLTTTEDIRLFHVWPPRNLYVRRSATLSATVVLPPEKFRSLYTRTAPRP